MSEEIIPQTEEALLVPETASPAQQLGLIDGQFMIPRTGKPNEAGWTIDSYEDVTDPRTGNREVAVHVFKLAEIDGVKTRLDKAVKYSDIMRIKEEAQDKELTEGKVALVNQVSLELIEKDDDVEVVHDERSKKLFGPLESDIENSSIDDSRYDHLFSPDFDERKYSVEDAAVRSSGGRGVVSEMSEEFTLNEVLSRFGENGENRASIIADILRKYIPEEVGLNSRDAMEAIRANLDLRVELGELFLKRQEIYKDVLPTRVASNGEKSPTIAGYRDLGKFSSREYVAMLALSKLDGTFNVDSSSSDPIDISEDGTVIRGQHRVASDKILFW